MATQPPALVRSSIDPVTGITLLAPVRLEEHLGSFLQGRLPAVALPALLHEGTHHWCFFSPVGLALTLLNLRARRRALRLAVTEGSDPHGAQAYDMMDDYVRYDALMRAQAPLAEGLATFAEFDAVPVSARVGTDLMFALTSFLPGEGDGPARWRQLTGTLLEARTSTLYADQKTSLLASPMRDNEGYLSGYLTVKGMWQRAKDKNIRLADTEFFLNLLVYYIYFDFGLVAHLLDPDTSDDGTATIVVNYLAQRLVNFEPGFDADWLDVLEEQADLPLLDENVEGTLGDVLESIPALATDPELVDAGRERLLRIYDELETEASAEDALLGSVSRYQTWVLSQRQLLCVGRLDVEVDYAREKWARVWREGRLICSGPSTSGAFTGMRAGSLDLFINPWRWGRYLAIAVSVDENPVLSWFSRDLEPQIQEQFDNYRTNFAEALETSEALATLLEQALMAHDWAPHILPDTRDRLADWTARFYRDRALWFVGEEWLDTAVERTAKRGLYGVLGQMRLVRALAWISLNWMVNDAESLASEFRDANDFHDAGDDLWIVIDEIAAASESTIAIPLVSRYEGRLFCVV